MKNSGKITKRSLCFLLSLLMVISLMLPATATTDDALEAVTEPTVEAVAVSAVAGRSWPEGREPAVTPQSRTTFRSEGSPGRTIDLNATDWRIAPGVEHMITVPVPQQLPTTHPLWRPLEDLVPADITPRLGDVTLTEAEMTELLAWMNGQTTINVNTGQALPTVPGSAFGGSGNANLGTLAAPFTNEHALAEAGVTEAFGGFDATRDWLVNNQRALSRLRTGDLRGEALHTLSDHTLEYLVPGATGLFDGVSLAGQMPAPVADAAGINPDTDTSDWLPARVPGTIVGNLMSYGMYDHLFEEGNDGSFYENFNINRTVVPMDFDVPWWYSKDIELTAADVAAGRHQTLFFRGLNYTAEVFVNGVQVHHENRSVTSRNELMNRIGELYLEGDNPGLAAGSHMDHDFVFFGHGYPGTPENPNPRYNQTFPVDSIRRGPFTYIPSFWGAFPNTVWPDEGVSTAHRGEWEEF